MILFNRNRPVAALIFLLFLIHPPGSLAGENPELDSGITAFFQGDYKKALKIFTPLAKAGNAEAQKALGLIYLARKRLENCLEKSSLQKRKRGFEP